MSTPLSFQVGGNDLSENMLDIVVRPTGGYFPVPKPVA